MDMSPFEEKWKSFNWHVISIDGHDIEAVIKALEEAKTVKGKPTVFIANTVKGKGVSFMEDQVNWHGVAPSKEEAEKAVAELESAKV